MKNTTDEDRYDVEWISMWEKPIRFTDVDTNQMQKLYRDGRDNQYKVNVYPRPMAVAEEA